MMKYEQPSVEIIYMNGSVIATSQGSLQEGNDEQDYGDWNTNF